METRSDVTDRFWRWAQEELERRYLTWYAVERKAGLSGGAISKRVDQEQPTDQTCRAIARLFDLPPEIVFYRGGLLPWPNHMEHEMQELISTLKHLSDEDLDRVMIFVEALYRYYQRETEAEPTARVGEGGVRPEG